MTLRRYLPVIAGVVFALAGGSALVAWLTPPPVGDPYAGERVLPPIPERAPRARRAPRPVPVPVPPTTAAEAAAKLGAEATDPAGCTAAAAPATAVAVRPADAPATMIGACPGGTPP